MKTINKIRADSLAKYFYKLAEQSQDVFWIRSADYAEQVYISPAYEQIWGITCKELYEDPSLWMATMHPEDRERITRESAASKAPPKIGEINEKNYRILQRDKSIRWIKDVSFGLFDDEGNCFGYAGTCKDVSKDVLHKQELQNEKIRAEVANQAKADFLAKMSHEFRTPLNAILGIIQVMSAKQIGAEFQEYMSIINQAGSSLLALVEDILDFAKLEVSELSISHNPVDMHILISQVINSFFYKVKGTNVELHLDYPDDVPRLVVSDAQRMRQIFTNLINNAIKFTDEGYVRIEVRCLNKRPSEPLFEFKVIDTGIGIAETDFDYIFEKFGQVGSVHDRNHQGTGLGLSIVRHLLHKLGGTISVESEVGQGSTFTFQLPLKLQGEAYSTSELNRSYHLNEDGEFKQLNLNCLLVEDNQMNQKIAKLMLGEIGCRVHTVSNGKDALFHLNENSQYDAILMDIGLPDMDGFEVAHAIRQNHFHKSVPIIAMTAHALECDKEKCYASGMNDVIIKPIPYEQLYKKLQACAVGAAI